MKNVVGEGTGPVSDDPEDGDDVMELTMTAPGEGAEGGHEAGGHPGSLPEHPHFLLGCGLGARIHELQ